ncbi:MAG: tail fiber domain-containing protein [Ferruginibacter sp.]
MKHVILILIFLPFFAMAQNVGIGTDIPAGKLHIKGTEDISQLVVEANATQSINKPLLVLSKGGTTYLSINSDGPSNVFMGYLSGNANVTNSGNNITFIGGRAGMVNTTGHSNTAVGYASLLNNTTGYYLTAIGSGALSSNTTGRDNIAMGYNALASNRGKSGSIAIGNNAMSYSNNTVSNTYTGNIAIGMNALHGSFSPANNTGSNNTAIGDYSMYAVTSGINNTALGVNTLYKNTNGHYNSAIGVQALYNNFSGLYNSALGINALYTNVNNSYNTGIGYNALFGTTASDYNTAVGSQAGDSYNNSYNNVFVGANADVNGVGYFNVVAVGQGTVATGVSMARFGNGATTSYGGYANWTNISDGRFKSNVQENVPGLAFINKLRPVTYNLDAMRLDAFLHKNDTPEKQAMAGKNIQHLQALHEKEQITYTGFIAQEVEKTAKELGFDFSGVDNARNENDSYGLRYAEFVVPLVKAVQEQQQLIDKQQEQINLLIYEVQLLKAGIKRN